MSQVQRGHISGFISWHLQQCSLGDANHPVLSRNSPAGHSQRVQQFWMNLVIILGLSRDPGAPYSRPFFGVLCC